MTYPDALKTDTANASTNRVDIANLYKAKLKIVKDCTAAEGGCFASSTNLLNGNFCTNFEASGNFANARLVLQNGMALAFEYNGPTWAPNYFYVYLDINGTKLPNQLGRDTFSFYYDSDKNAIVPTVGANCYLPGGSGYGCADLIIRESAISYY